MPSDRSYGNILRIEREHAGYDLTSMSRRLHIRPDILQAIENSDFDRMPARGYSKNMVRAYARALKLDEQAITEMFLDEMHMHEVGAPRRSTGQRGSYGAGQAGSSRAQGRPAGREDGYGRPGRSPRGNAGAGRRPQGRGGRDLVDAGARPRRGQQAPAGQQAAGRGRQRQAGRQEPGMGERMAMGLGSLVGSITQGRGRGETKVPRSFNTIGSTPPYARASAGRGAQGGVAAMNLPMILAIVAAVVVLLIVVVVISNGSKQAAEDVPDIPISGLTDTSSPEDNPEGTTVDTAPEFAEFKYAVESGGKSWIEIYQDGSETPSFAQVVEGPADATFEVRDSLTLRTGNPSPIKLELDGEEVEFQKESGSQQYYFTVDFQDILNQWNIDHGRAPASSSKASSSSAGSKSSSSKASSSSKSSSSSSSKGSSSSSGGSSSTR